jgi:predicted DNA-binding protein (MmcQ/YjbR family)
MDFPMLSSVCKDGADRWRARRPAIEGGVEIADNRPERRRMTHESIRDFCLGLPHATEIVQWESHLLFKVGGKMFAILDLDGRSCAFRCTPDRYAELVELPDVVPASHNMWKYQWVTTETLSALPDREYRELLTQSHDIVRATLPRKVRSALDGTAPAEPRKKDPPPRRRASPPKATAKRR